MAYNKKKIHAKIIDICKKGGVTTIDDAAAFVGVTRQLLYKWWSIDSPEKLAIDEAIQEGKRKAIVSIRSKLYRSQNPTALIALYKMLCTEEERSALNQTKTDITTNGKDIKPDPIIVEIIDRREQVEQGDIVEEGEN